MRASTVIVAVPADLERRTPRACQLAVALAARASGDLVEVSADDVASVLGWGRATAYRALSELVDAGLVAREPEGLRLLWLSPLRDESQMRQDVSQSQMRQSQMRQDVSQSQSHQRDTLTDDTESLTRDEFEPWAERVVQLERRVALLARALEDDDDVDGEEAGQRLPSAARVPASSTSTVTAEELAAVIAAAPGGLTRAEIDPLYPLSERTLRLRLSEAVDAGLIEKRREGNAVRYQAVSQE